MQIKTKIQFSIAHHGENRRFFLFICAEPQNLRKKINIFTIGTRYQPSFDYLYINL